MGQYTLSKSEILRGEKSISRLFNEGQSGFSFPFRYVWRVVETGNDSAPVSVMFSVPKKHFKRAVKRNLLKRRTREAYRLNKEVLVKVVEEKNVRIELALIYATKDECNFKTIENGVKRILAEVGKRC